MSQIERQQGGRSASSPLVVRRALLVGIRTYPNIPGTYGPTLAGCHNDVVHMHRALRGRGFDAEHIEVLTDRLEGCPCQFCSREIGSSPGGVEPTTLPTRDTILAAMERLLAATDPGDLVVFYYSGHGSELSARGRRTGRRFQTFVPHDSGRGEAENRDIGDWEIQQWMHRMAGRTQYLTMILDCCHSGGLSDLRGEEKALRGIAPDERRDPAAYTPALLRVGREDEEATTDSGLRGGERPSAVVLSASAAKELSAETEADGLRQGLFTHHLTRVLARPPVEGETWADLFPEVARGVNGENLAQHPRRGGNGPVFEPGAIDTDDIEPPDIIELAKLAVVIGIDYRREDGEAETRPGFTPLVAPCRDAEAVARVLEEDQGYEIVGISEKSAGPLLGERAIRRRIHKVLHRLAAVKAKTRRETAVVVYFAGHGLVRSEPNGDQKGYLIPWDADPDDPSTWLAMQDLRDQLVDGISDPERLEQLEQHGPLERLKCRHLLLIFDCCFGGAMAYDFFRGGGEGARPIYYSEYKRFVEGTAWQLLSSASFNQQALDRDPSGSSLSDAGGHSPFAQALLEGLGSDVADSGGGEDGAGGRGDHLVTASELHRYIDRRLKAMGVDVQTPGLTDLRPGDGQFIFTVPGFAPSPLPDPTLHPDANPWHGEGAYGPVVDEPAIAGGGTESTDTTSPAGAGETAADDELFYGRERATLDLLAAFLACYHHEPGKAAKDGDDTTGRSSPALMVVGPSGSGITSLLRAGLLALLDDPTPYRDRLRSWARREGQHHLLPSRDDLRSVRRWIEARELVPLLEVEEDTGPDAVARAEAIAQTIRSWGVEVGWLEPGGHVATDSGGRGRQSLGVPSFEEKSLDDGERDWLRRLGLVSLLEHPIRLMGRLALWWKRWGLADFMTVSDRALPGLVGRWRVISKVDEVPTRGETPGDEPKAGGGERILWLADPLDQAIDNLDPAAWETLLDRPDLQIVGALRSDTLARRPRVAERLAAGGRSGTGWRLHRPVAPDRDALWWVVQGPASARVLFFEPPALAETLVEEAATTRAPLALLSMALHHMVIRAWERRGSDDRQLTAADLEPVAGEGAEARPTPSTVHGNGDNPPRQPIAHLLAHRAEALYRRLVGEDPARRRSLRAVLLRAITLDQGRVALRPVAWRELELADPDEERRLEREVLPALIDARLLVAGERHLELACPDLVEAWPRLRRWLAVLDRRGARWQALWQQALAWEASDFSHDKLWLMDRQIPRLARSRVLNHLEWAFVVTSELAGRATAAETLAGLASRLGESDWTRGAVLAVELVRRCRGTMGRIEILLEELERNIEGAADPGGQPDGAAELSPSQVGWVGSASLESTRRAAREVWERSRQLAEQTLRQVLAATPLSLPLVLPEGIEGPLEGLAFADRQTLRARVGGRIVEWRVEESTVGVPAKGIRRPAKGDGEVRPQRALGIGPEIPFPAVPPVRLPLPPRGPNAQTGHDRSIRYFAPGQLRIPPPMRPAPARLLGHRGVPTFLTFAPRTRSLAPPWLRRLEGDDAEQRSVPHWLASGARLDDGTPDVRLWPIEADGTLAGEPRSRLGPELRDWFEELLAEEDPEGVAVTVAAWRASRASQLGAGPSLLEADGALWVLESVAEDGASLTLRSPDGGKPFTLDIPTRDVRGPDSVFIEGLREIQLGPEGRLLAVVTRSGWAGIWSLPGRELLWSSNERVATLAWGPVIEGGFDRRAHRRLAIAYLDGTVRLWWSDPRAEYALPDPEALPIELRSPATGRNEGFAVRALAFVAEGRQLLVERRAIYEPFDRRLDLYRLELGELVELARRHAGRELESDDLPLELRSGERSALPPRRAS